MNRTTAGPIPKAVGDRGSSRAPAGGGLLTATRGAEGFTLIEMLAVLAIVGIMMVITVGAFGDWGRGAGLRGSVLNVRSSVMLARQYTITHRDRAGFTYGNLTDSQGKTNGYFVITNSAGQLIGATNFLTPGISFAIEGGAPTATILFDYDGSCLGDNAEWQKADAGGMLAKEIVLREQRANRSLMATTLVFKLTGQAKSKEWVD